MWGPTDPSQEDESGDDPDRSRGSPQDAVQMVSPVAGTQWMRRLMVTFQHRKTIGKPWKMVVSWDLMG